MIDSILTSIKKDLGIEKADTQFDPEITSAINTALMVLNQNGVGPSEGLIVTGESETWDDLIGGEGNNMQAVKTYIYLSVKLDFDPPDSGPRIEAMKRRKDELEWRLNTQAETNI